MNKKGIIGIVILFIVGIFVGFRISNKGVTQQLVTENNEIKAEAQDFVVDIVLKDSIDVEVNTKLPEIYEYFDDYVEFDYDVRYYENEKEVTGEYVISNIGTYKVEIRLNTLKYNTKLNVKDTVNPELKLSDLTITVGDKYNEKSFVKSCTDNSKKDCNLSFASDEMSKYNKAGNYNISIIASDSSNNKITQTAKLVIKDKTTPVKNSVKSAKTSTSKTSKSTVDKTSNKSKYKTTSDLKDQASKLVSKNKAEANEVLKYTNTYREQAGVSKLVLDDKLSLVANIRAIEIALYDKFAHVRPNGTSFSTVLSESNIKVKIVGENLAEGQINPKEACSDWKDSQGHYENMVRPQFNKLGVGIYTYNGITYWVQIFSD